MEKTAKLLSLVFHPIAIPIFTVLLYFTTCHLYFSRLEIALISVQVFITTALLPICSYFLLKSLGFLSSSIMINTRKERIAPLFLNLVFLLILKNNILYNNSAYLIHLYISDLVICYVTLLFFTLMKQKTSVHTTVLTASFMFYYSLLINEQQPNILGVIVFILIIGCVASARLILKAHTTKEVVQAFFIGLLPTLLTLLENIKH